VEQSRRFLVAARELGFGLKLALDGQPPPGAIAVAVELGAASIGNPLNVTPDEAALLAQSQTVAVLAPGPAFYLGTEQYPPARMLPTRMLPTRMSPTRMLPTRMLIDGGVAVALASYYHPHWSPSHSMQMMIALACGAMRMTPAEAVTAATINAAHALRQASNTGSIEPAKCADLLILGVPDYREIPYHFGMNLVDLVMKNGIVLMERSEVKWPTP
jgi:imidazolonepropionase